MKKLIYTAGKYRDSGWHGVWENIMAARDVARELWKKGWVVICPHTNTILMDGPDIDADTFIEGDLEIISRCDALFMLPGWETSQGANIEFRHALDLHMPIYYNLDEVPNVTE